MSEEISSDLSPTTESGNAPRSNRRTTLVSLVILSAVTLGLLAWWLWPRRAEPAATATEAKTAETTAEKKEEKAGEAAPSRVELSAEALKRANIETAEVTSQALTQVLTATGRLALNEDAVVRVGTFVDGRVVHVFAKVGDYVRKGQTLVHIHSHELTDARGAVAKAKASLVEKEKALAFAQAEADRAERLFTAKAIAKREVDQANAHVVAIKAETELVKAELERASEFLEHLAIDQDAPDEVAIRSTLSGIVTKRLITEGTVVSDASDLMEIANISTLWAVAEVPEAQATFARIGQGVNIQLSSLGDATISGKVVHIGTSLNPETRTVQVRCLVNNPRGNLRPEMYATINISGGAAPQGLAVPREAVQEVNGEKVVFVALENNAFEKRAVQLGREQGNLIEITDGLQTGLRVVTKGGFFIKTEFLKGSLAEE
ncbi:MAG: efflux RND transporter periplasmic adaptor subunit [Acidobacteria bacterium]|nr:efflux RND transporter periplasmic adaptor subunit [Acidobacteriota bacterium]